jgi:hypothetical protein
MLLPDSWPADEATLVSVHDALVPPLPVSLSCVVVVLESLLVPLYEPVRSLPDCWALLLVATVLASV